MKLSKKARVLAAALALTLAAGIMGGCGGDKKEEAAAKKKQLMLVLYNW